MTNWTTADSKYISAMTAIPADGFNYALQVGPSLFKRYGYMWLISTEYEDELDPRNRNVACSEDVGEGLPFRKRGDAMKACERYFERAVASADGGDDAH